MKYYEVENLFMPMRHFGVQIHFNGNDDGFALIFVCWMYDWNGYRVGSGRKGSTFVLLCAHLTLKMLWISVRFIAVWLTFMHYHYRSEYTTIMALPARWMCETDIVLVFEDERLRRTFVLVCAHLNLTVLLIFNAVGTHIYYEITISRVCIRFFVIQIHSYNGDDGSALIFIFLNILNGVLLTSALDKQLVRFRCCPVCLNSIVFIIRSMLNRSFLK